MTFGVGGLSGGTMKKDPGMRSNNQDQMNHGLRMHESHSRYWALKEQILGVSAPMARSQEDLDPPTIFHINQVLILKSCETSKRQSLIEKYQTLCKTFFGRTLTWSVTSPEPSYSSSLLQSFVTFRATLDRCTGKVLPKAISERFKKTCQQKYFCKVRLLWVKRSWVGSGKDA